ncbi:uncharacterized protein LOC111704303 isoform X3 [Eurytemora carolleeae]|uniref:uncharacterized protein LOC111704303 isoform X3 n=1 Tax=Eurytemora carolleeae TaxID=1294199 RepID=UPI000C78745F|nr:uncharacterized protein LOC111704303 isoform X3 [Eurytemora carolleeae]|eukprot:XP_023332284.1 uncharacterized protein LOC111704303 isoform X3 [Eurytemora affinis]
MFLCSRDELLEEIQRIKAVTDDKRILKHILTDILNLRNGMEDNLLLIQQIHLMIQKEGKEQKEFNDIINIAQQQIDSISTLYTLGVSWLKGETDFSLHFIQDSSAHESRERVGDDALDMEDDCNDIKIEMEEIENIVPVDPGDILQSRLEEEQGLKEVKKDVKYSWEVFQTFEKMFFNPENGDFFQFMDNWNNRLQDAIKAGLEYPNNILAFKIISCSNLSAHAQSQVIAALQKEYRDNCNILHLTMHLLNKETALAQEYNSDPLEMMTWLRWKMMIK